MILISHYQTWSESSVSVEIKTNAMFLTWTLGLDILNALLDSSSREMTENKRRAILGRTCNKCHVREDFAVYGWHVL